MQTSCDVTVGDGGGGGWHWVVFLSAKSLCACASSVVVVLAFRSSNGSSLFPLPPSSVSFRPIAAHHASHLNRKHIEGEKDKGLRDAARVTLRELEESLSQGLALVSSDREHPGIKPQADTGKLPPPPPVFHPSYPLYFFLRLRICFVCLRLYVVYCTFFLVKRIR